MRAPSLPHRSGPPLRPPPLLLRLLPLLVLFLANLTPQGLARARFATERSPVGATLVSAEIAFSFRT